MDDSHWEQFVEEWTDSLKTKYAKVERLGGAGDQGRDICGYLSDGPNSIWDNYQCKHYASPLTPTNIWVELGKLFYYTFAGVYSMPRKYYFCAPRGAGTKLANLLRKPEQLRNDLIANWASYCEKGITSTASVTLDGALLAYVLKADFEIFTYLTQKELIDGHRLTRHHVIRFGNDFPERNPPNSPSPMPASHEAVYVRQLLDAYADNLKLDVPDITSIPGKLRTHFDRSRVDFYYAESLREFSRDNLPEGEFERLQNQIHSHVADVIESSFSDGLSRLRATTLQARNLSIDSHPLKSCIQPQDKSGVCHQLANDKKIRWVEDK